MFTKRHYEMIAAVLRSDKDNGVQDHTNSFVKMLQQDNKHFDAHKFRRACGWE